jgi:uncharacterized protein
VDIEVTHEPSRRRFVARVGEHESQLSYVPTDEGVVDFRSTFVHPSARGKGVGEKIVQKALEWARSEGLRVIPSCWFVDTVVRRHPEYQPLLDR